MAELIVEIHVPLAGQEGLPPSSADHDTTWVDEVEDCLVGQEEDGVIEVYDDGEELAGEYVFFVTGASEAELLAAAARVTRLPGVPGGAYAVLTDDEEELGVGQRRELT